MGKYWVFLGDFFINDVFGIVYCKYVFNVGIVFNMLGKVVVGFLMEKEIKFLGDVVINLVCLFVVILGGVKVFDKIGVINNLFDKVDKVIVGGGMIYIFYVVKGIKIGNFLVEEDKIDVVKEILEKVGDKLVLLVDNVVVDKFVNDVNIKVVEGDIDDGWMVLDIGLKLIEEFKKVLVDVKIVVWNGLMGVFEMSNFVKGILEVG